MDYCSPCRRHLNGALACPGCGTPVEIAEPPLETPREGAADDASETPEADSVRPGGRRAAREARNGRGRTQSRRRRSRKGRRTVVITGGLLLAVGVLGLAELATEAPWESPASSAQAEDDPAGSDSPAASKSAERIASESGSGVPKDPSASDSATASDSASPSESASASASASAISRTSEPAPGATEPAEQPPATKSSAPAPPPPASTPPNSPDPTPSESCARFLWWCS